MPRPEPGTPKYLANKMKAKGLQKLRWYCQMCQKQCRDENGFKCHITSESHQRQLLLFADNSRRFLTEFSKEFAQGYLEILKRRFGTKRIAANRVYQEYISDRNHTHMNATHWTSLAGFVKWLGKTGKCIVDETEKGWFISYIDRDPETIKRQEQMAKKVKMDKDDHERMMEFIEKQIEKGKEKSKDIEEPSVSDLVRSEDEKITLELPVFKKPKDPVDINQSPLVQIETQKVSNKQKKKNVERKTSALDEIMKEEEDRRKKVRKRDYWLHPDIVVKVVTDSLGEKYLNKKGVVEEVEKYVGIIRMIDSGAKLKLDQEHLETVIPAIGRKVKILNGAYSKLLAELLDINSDKFCVDLKITSGPLHGKIVREIPYEDISKLHV